MPLSDWEYSGSILPTSHVRGVSFGREVMMMTTRAVAACPQAEVLMKIEALLRRFVLVSCGKADEICGRGIQPGGLETSSNPALLGASNHSLPCCETELPWSATRTRLRCRPWHPCVSSELKSTSFVRSSWCVCQIPLVLLLVIEENKNGMT
jgi:hypothetical protein